MVNSVFITMSSDDSFFLFFLTPFPVYCEEYTIIRCLSFQVSVGHISCTIWSSPQLSTYEFSFYCGITSHIMLLPWGPSCLGSASFAPRRPRQHRHLRGLAPSPSKDHCPGAGYIVFVANFQVLSCLSLMLGQIVA